MVLHGVQFVAGVHDTFGHCCHAWAGPGVVPQMLNGCTVQSEQPVHAAHGCCGPGVVPQMLNAWNVQSEHCGARVHPQPPPPISGGPKPSGTTVTPNSLIFGMDSPPRLALMPPGP